jgi:hypothetical protein
VLSSPGTCVTVPSSNMSVCLSSTACVFRISVPIRDMNKGDLSLPPCHHFYQALSVRPPQC